MIREWTVGISNVLNVGEGRLGKDGQLRNSGGVGPPRPLEQFSSGGTSL